MTWVQASSDSIGVEGCTYAVAKYPTRRQWALIRCTPHVIHAAAYFRTEEEARTFAATFGLTITDHQVT